MNLSTKVLIVAGVGAAALLGLYLTRGSIASAAAAAGNLFNPTSSDNLAYQGANALTRAVTNDPYSTLGTKIWEWMNPASVAAERTMLAGLPATGAAAGFSLAPSFTALDNEDADLGNYMREADLSNPAGPSYWRLGR